MRQIFVSSTFKDMHAERDMLHEMVIPEINEFVQKYGEAVTFTDLRWGINTSELDSEDGARKVLKICLGEIETCRPYMIVLLGDRYGWIPNQDLLRSAIEEAVDLKKQQNKDYSNILSNFNKSVTELEIEYGALEDPEQLEKCFFYFRNPLPYDKMTEKQREIFGPGSDDDYIKISELKKKIENKCKSQVRSYDAGWDEKDGRIVNLDTLKSQVLKDIKKELVKELGEVKEVNWQDRETLGFRNLIRSKCNTFIGRDDILDKCYAFLENREQQIFLLKGEAGSGKSSIMCQLVQQLEQRADTTVLPFFCGVSVVSGTVQGFADYAIASLESLVYGKLQDHHKEDAFDKKREYLAELATEYLESGKKLVFVIDALDQLQRSDIAEKFLWISSEFPKAIKIFCSCTYDFPAMPWSYVEDLLHMESIPAISYDECILAINHILKCNHKETLPKEVMGTILKKSNTKNYLYLSFIVQRLMMLDEEDYTAIEEKRLKGEDGQFAIIRFMLQLIQDMPGDLIKAGAAIMSEACRRINTASSANWLQLIAASRRGLRLQDLKTICKINSLPWDTLDFTVLRRYLGTYLTMREDGRIDFSHRTLREGLNADKASLERCEGMIFEYLCGLSPTDPLKVDEMVYFSYRRKNYEALGDYLYTAASIEKWDSEQQWTWVRDITSLQLKDICKAGGTEWICQNLEKWLIDNDRIEKMALLFCYGVFHFFYTEKNLEDLMQIKQIIVQIVKHVEKNIKVAKSFEAVSALRSCCSRLGDVFELEGDYPEALDAYKNSVRFGESAAFKIYNAVNFEELAYCYQKTGEVLVKLGSDKEAMAYYEKSIRFMLAIDIAGSSSDAWKKITFIYMRMGRIMLDNNQTEDGIKYLNEAEAISKSHIDEVDYESMRNLAILNTETGYYYKKLEQYSKANEQVFKAIKIFEELESKWQTDLCSEDLGETYFNYAGILRRQNKFEEMFTFHDKAVKIRNRLAKKQGTAEAMERLLTSYNVLSSIYDESEDDVKTLEYMKKAYEVQLELSEKLYTKESWLDFAALIKRLVDKYEETGDKENAAQNYISITTVFKLILAKENWYDAEEKIEYLHYKGVAYEEAGNIYNTFGDFNKACNLFRMSSEEYEKIIYEMGDVSYRTYLLSSYYLYAEMLERLGLMDMANNIYEKFHKVAIENLDDEKDADSYHNYAFTCYHIARIGGTKDYASAQKRQEALDIWKRLYAQTKDNKYKGYIEMVEKL